MRPSLSAFLGGLLFWLCYPRSRKAKPLGLDR